MSVGTPPQRARHDSGTRLLPAVWPAALCEHWQRSIAAAVTRRRNGNGNGNDADYSPHGSSLRLRALADFGLDPLALARSLWRGPLRKPIDALFCGPVALLADQCWARCQYAPVRAPPGHVAHGWHQDGALHFDFQAPQAAGTPLRLLTAWIALSACGEDAPGLELLCRPLPTLLPPGELEALRVQRGHAPGDFWRPLLSPGDLLLFGGDILHRTHVAPTMGSDRVSLELRFVAADEDSPRLRGERILLLQER
jgi:hypothetical protein